MGQCQPIENQDADATAAPWGDSPSACTAPPALRSHITTTVPPHVVLPDPAGDDDIDTGEPKQKRCRKEEDAPMRDSPPTPDEEAGEDRMEGGEAMEEEQ